MAEDEGNNEEENEEEAAEEESPVQKKSAAAPEAAARDPMIKLMVILFAALCLLVVVLVALVASQIYSKKAEVSVGDVVAQSSDAHGGEHGADKAGDKGDKKEEVDPEDAYIKESFTINLQGAGRQHYAKVDVVIEVEDDFVKVEVKRLRPKIRDFVNVVLSSKTFEQVESVDGRNFLREEIRNKINGYLARGEIKNVYFTQFIIQ